MESDFSSHLFHFHSHRDIVTLLYVHTSGIYYYWETDLQLRALLTSVTQLPFPLLPMWPTAISSVVADWKSLKRLGKSCFLKLTASFGWVNRSSCLYAQRTVLLTILPFKFSELLNRTKHLPLELDSFRHPTNHCLGVNIEGLKLGHWPAGRRQTKGWETADFYCWPGRRPTSQLKDSFHRRPLTKLIKPVILDWTSVLAAHSGGIRNAVVVAPSWSSNAGCLLLIDQALSVQRQCYLRETLHNRW